MPIANRKTVYVIQIASILFGREKDARPCTGMKSSPIGSKGYFLAHLKISLQSPWSYLMRFFINRRFDESQQHRQAYSTYEILYSLVDFIAALCFIVGSIFFFYKSLMTAGTWLFLVGSLCFALRPTIRLCREIHLDVLSRKLEKRRNPAQES
jgi:hypothetical protein